MDGRMIWGNGIFNSIGLGKYSVLIENEEYTIIDKEQGARLLVKGKDIWELKDIIDKSILMIKHNDTVTERLLT